MGSNGLHAKPIDANGFGPLGMHPYDEPEIPEELKRIKEKMKNPDVKVSFGDRLYYYTSVLGKPLVSVGRALDNYATGFIGKTLRQMVPPYVWWSVIGLFGVFLIGIVLIIVL